MIWYVVLVLSDSTMFSLIQLGKLNSSLRKIFHHALNLHAGNLYFLNVKKCLLYCTVRLTNI